MDSNPVPPKASQIDPWSGPDSQGQPQAPSQPQAPQNDPNANDPDDLFGGLGGGGVVGGSGAAIMVTLMDKACTKLKGCTDIDQSIVAVACDQFKSLPKAPLPANCPSAQRCMDAIDGMSCSSANGTNPMTAIYQLSDCMTAVTDC